MTSKSTLLSGHTGICHCAQYQLLHAHRRLHWHGGHGQRALSCSSPDDHRQRHGRERRCDRNHTHHCVQHNHRQDQRTTPSGTAKSATHFYVGTSLPTITSIANQTINQNTSTSALAFTVGDSMFRTNTLIMTGVSCKPSLLPTIRIVFGGTGASRTEIMTPAANQSGRATITLTVTDGGGMTPKTSFTVTVNCPPTITAIANQLINMGTATSALAFMVADDLTAKSALSVAVASSNTSLVKPAGIVLTGPDASGTCTVKVTPVATYRGLTTIMLTVTDGRVDLEHELHFDGESPHHLCDRQPDYCSRNGNGHIGVCRER